MREKNQETRADIIAEMRMGNPVGPCVYRIGLPDKEEVYESGAKRRITMIKNVTVQELADRLEAAEKREKAQHGNVAEMREAIVAFVRAYEMNNELDNIEATSEAYEKARAALSIPPRNCDVGTAEEQTKRFSDFCAAHRHTDLPRCAGCPLENTPSDTGCSFAWAQMPYKVEKGEADGV